MLRCLILKQFSDLFIHLKSVWSKEEATQAADAAACVAGWQSNAVQCTHITPVYASA